MLTNSFDSSSFGDIPLYSSFPLENETPEPSPTSQKIPFKDRSKTYKVAFVAGCIIGFPVIGAYYSYTHSKGTLTEVAKKIVAQARFVGLIVASLPQKINQSVIQPAIKAASNAKKWVVTHVLNPISLKINLIATRLLIQFPVWFQDKIIFPVKFIATQVINAAEKNIIKPIIKIATYAKAILTETLPRKIIQAYTYSKNWTDKHILIPLTHVLQNISYALFVTLPKQFNETIIKPFQHAVSIAAAWTQDHVLNPLLKLTESICEMVTKTIPQSISKLVTKVSVWTNEKILKPLQSIIQAASEIISETIKPFIMQKVIKPIIENYKIAATWIQNAVVTPLINAINIIFKVLFITVPQKINEVFQYSIDWVSNKILAPLVFSVKTAVMAAFKTIDDLWTNKIIPKMCDLAETIADWTMNRLVDPTLRAIEWIYNTITETIPRAVCRLSVNVADWTYHHVYIPLLNKIYASIEIFNVIGSQILKHILTPVGKGILDGIKWTNNKVFRPIGRKILKVAGQIFYAARFTKQWLNNHVMVPVMKNLIALGQIILSIPGSILEKVLIPIGQRIVEAMNWTRKNVLHPIRQKISELVQEYFIDLPREMYKQSLIAFRQGIKWARQEVLNPAQKALNELYQTIIVETAIKIKETVLVPLKAELSNFKDEIVEAVFEQIEKVKSLYHKRFNKNNEALSLLPQLTVVGRI